MCVLSVTFGIFRNSIFRTTPLPPPRAIIKVSLFSIGDKMTEGYNRNFFLFFGLYFTLKKISNIFTHLKLLVAVARHTFKWVKIKIR